MKEYFVELQCRTQFNLFNCRLITSHSASASYVISVTDMQSFPTKSEYTYFFNNMDFDLNDYGHAFAVSMSRRKRIPVEIASYVHQQNYTPHGVQYAHASGAVRDANVVGTNLYAEAAGKSLLTQAAIVPSQPHQELS